jgi:F-type H+-transporting ATPase subunit b
VALLALAEGAIQLVPDGTLLFHLAAIIAMVAVLNATLFKPINRVLEERERRTKGTLGDAANTLLIVDEKLRDYENRLRTARAEGYALMEQDRLLTSAKREQEIASVKAELSERLSKEKEKIRAEAASVREHLKDDTKKRAIEISRQILHRPITGEE